MRQEWSRSFLIIAVPSLLCLPLPLSYIKQINILMLFTYYPIIGIVTVPVILTFFLNLTFFLIVPVLFCLQKHLQFAIPTTLLPAVGLNKVRYLKLCNNDVIIIISHKYTIRRVRVNYDDKRNELRSFTWSCQKSGLLITTSSASWWYVRDKVPSTD